MKNVGSRIKVFKWYVIFRYQTITKIILSHLYSLYKIPSLVTKILSSINTTFNTFF